MKISFASTQDCKQIHQILQEHLIDINDQNIHQNKGLSGFLIRNVSEAQIKNSILDIKNNLVLVAKKDDTKENKKEDEVLGYLSSSRFGEIAEDIQNSVLPYLKKEGIVNLEKVIYHRQIAVKYDSGIKNIGSSLMESFLRDAKNAGYQYVVCRIILEPICNHKSIVFHQKFGFEQIGIVEEEKGIVAGVYLKKLTD